MAAPRRVRCAGGASSFGYRPAWERRGPILSGTNPSTLPAPASGGRPTPVSRQGPTLAKLRGVHTREFSHRTISAFSVHPGGVGDRNPVCCSPAVIARKRPLVGPGHHEPLAPHRESGGTVQDRKERTLMLGIHRTARTLFGRRAGHGTPSRTRHHTPRQRFTLEPLEGRALLSTWTVNSLGDTGAGSGLSGDLRYVINQADVTPGENTIEFSVSGTITLYSPLPDLSNTTGSMDIQGPGATNLTVARNGVWGTPDFGIFTVDANAAVNLAGLTITEGSADFDGGGIANYGSLTVSNSIIANNSAYLSGGGIENAGTMTIASSTIANNLTAHVQGGGIDNPGR